MTEKLSYLTKDQSKYYEFESQFSTQFDGHFETLSAIAFGQQLQDAMRMSDFGVIALNKRNGVWKIKFRSFRFKRAKNINRRVEILLKVSHKLTQEHLQMIKGFAGQPLLS